MKPVSSPLDMVSMQVELNRVRKEAARYRVRALNLEKGLNCSHFEFVNRFYLNNTAVAPGVRYERTTG